MLSKKNMIFEHVKGHSGNPHNQRAHDLGQQHQYVGRAQLIQRSQMKNRGLMKKPKPV